MADTPNIELLETTYSFIEQNPKHWNQGAWRCKSGMCFAGWAAELTGGKWLVDVDVHKNDPDAFYAVEDYLVTVDEDGDLGVRTLSVGNEWVKGTHVQDRARRVLRLGWEDAEDLFEGTNDLASIRDVIDRIKERATADG